MANRLALAQSPYLRQHADNPVDWQEWGEEAFARARAEDKPIFLSIGYSTCHWCHVMAHESFENPDLAALLNTHFVPIKVDREERPDVDRVYMTYVQALTGHGGWPLSAWLTPDLKPFYGGTYFPPEDRGGRHGFGTVLRAIGGAWRDPAQRASMVAEGNRVVDVLRDHATASAPAGDLGSEELWLGAAQAAFERGFQYFQEAFDPVDGGFGSPPKFPRASVLTFLFRCAALQGVASETGRTALHLATHTLRRMAQGGIHDHVGGGFHRYSVDGRWFVPHFEKMLYDQAQIAVNYLDACRLTGDRRHGWLARDILDYVLRDLRHPDGGFYSAEDADSLIDHGKPDHAEGAFYVWTPEQLEAALGPEDAALAARHFAVRPGGNVPAELDPHGEFRGRCILAQGQPLSSTAEAAGLDLESANERVLHLLERLREARRQRPRPHLDTKIITAWNGLAISAFARAHVVLERTEGNADSPYLQAAIAAATFVRRELFDPATGLLYRTFGTVRGPHPAFAEDYAGLIAGLLDLHHATFDTRWLEWADALQTTMDARFWDEPAGGYFSAAAGDPSLILRLKDDYDGAEPAASSVAAGNLARLAQLLPDDTRAQRARRTIAAFHTQWSRHPQALPQMLVSLELTLESPRHVVLVGNPTSPDLLALARAVDEVVDLSPGVLVLRPDTPADAWLLRRAPWLAGMPRDAVPATAYVCHHYACQPPVTTPEALTAHLVAAIPRPAESRN